MTDKDYIDHAINSIIFHHKYDESYKITKAAREKEEEQIIDSLDVSDDTKEHLKNEINAMIAAENLSKEELRREMLGFVPKIHCKHYDFRSDVITFCEERKYKRELLGFIPKLHCQSCNREIPYDEKYVKDNLLYVTSDWTKCLCSRCTDAWKRRKEIAEAYPDFGKRVGYKMIIVDELNGEGNELRF